MKSTWHPILTVLVSLFGLVSCAPDQLPGQAPATPEPVKDSWVLTKPHIQRQGKISLMNIGENADETRVQADAALVFPSLEDHQGDGVTVELTMTCSHQGKQLQHQSTVRNTHILPLKSLLPLTLMTSAEQQELDCSLTGTATNSIGSRHSFTFEKLHIVEFARLFESTSLDSQIAARAAHSALSADNKPEARRICEHFENIRTLHAFAGQDIYKDLTEGPLVWREPPSLSPNGDPRLVVTRQRCQMVIESLDATTGLKKRWISAPALVRFAPPKPLITGRYTLGQASTGAELPTHSVFEVSITNPTREPIHIDAPAHLPKIFEFSAVYYINPTQSLVYPAIVEDLYLSVPGADAGLVSANEGRFMFTVEPGATALLTARLNSNRRCELNSTYAAGFAFRFLRSFELAMLIPTGDKDIFERIPLTWPIEFPMSIYDGTPSGWIPRDQWIATSGMQARPVLTPHSRKFCLAWSERNPF